MNKHNTLENINLKTFYLKENTELLVNRLNNTSLLFPKSQRTRSLLPFESILTSVFLLIFILDI